MKSTRRPLTQICLLAATMLVIVACGTSSDEAPADQAAPESEVAGGELPPGHPSLEPGAGDGMIAPPPPGSGSGTAGLGWTAPAGWTEEAPANPMRKGQYRVGEDATCVVYYFGPGEGGDAESNAARWVDEFEQLDGSPSREAAKLERIEVEGVPVMLVEVAGTYKEGTMGGAAQMKPNFMLLGAIAEGPDANWFFKFTGPESTVIAERAAFRAMVESLQRGG